MYSTHSAQREGLKAGPGRPEWLIKGGSAPVLPCTFIQLLSTALFSFSLAPSLSPATMSMRSSYSVRSSMSQVPLAQVSIQRTSVTPAYRAASIHGGAGGSGARISSASYSGLRSSMGAPASSMSSSFQVSATGASGEIMGNEKVAMQNLNDRLASYLDKVRSLEKANSKLELQIREALDKRGPDVRDYSRYQAILDDLRKKVSEEQNRDLKRLNSYILNVQSSY